MSGAGAGAGAGAAEVVVSDDDAAGTVTERGRGGGGDGPCYLCGKSHKNKLNQLLDCAKCGCRFHQRCYGLPYVYASCCKDSPVCRQCQKQPLPGIVKAASRRTAALQYSLPTFAELAFALLTWGPVLGVNPSIQQLEAALSDPARSDILPGLVVPLLKALEFQVTPYSWPDVLEDLIANERDSELELVPPDWEDSAFERTDDDGNDLDWSFFDLGCHTHVRALLSLVEILTVKHPALKSQIQKMAPEDVRRLTPVIGNDSNGSQFVAVSDSEGGARLWRLHRSTKAPAARKAAKATLLLAPTTTTNGGAGAGVSHAAADDDDDSLPEWTLLGSTEDELTNFAIGIRRSSTRPCDLELATAIDKLAAPLIRLRRKALTSRRVLGQLADYNGAPPGTAKPSAAVFGTRRRRPAVRYVQSDDEDDL